MDNYKKGQVAYDKKDYVQAISYWKPLAERGNLLAISSMADLYFTGDLRDTCLPEDYDQALYYFRLGSLQADAYCLHKLGHFYKCGFGVKRDMQRAHKLYLQATEQGSICAAHDLAMTYYWDDYKPDYNEAYYWLQYSAKKGFADSHYFLSEMYLYVIKVEKNYMEAYKHYVLFNLNAVEDCIFAIDINKKIKSVAKPMHIHIAKHLAKEFQRKYY